MKFLILAGGSGTRLWPLSRKNKPKQVQPLFDSATLLAKTYRRLTRFFKPSDIYIITNKQQAKLIKRELKGFKTDQLIIEPAARGTLAAIGFGSMYIDTQHPGEVVATVMSDHYIKNEIEYTRVLRQAARVVKLYPQTITLLGVKPSYPETGYGYIKMGDEVAKIKSGKKNDPLFLVEKFIEKPPLAQAQNYIKRWEYLWNPAYFLFYPRTLLKLYKKYNKPAGRSLERIGNLWRHKKSAPEVSANFSQIPVDSIDYGLLEKMDNLLVLPSDFGWTDVGHWRTVYEIVAKNLKDNIVKGNYLGIKSSGNLVYSLSDKLIATVGVDNFVIIETEDAILFCPKSQSQEVKQIVKELEKKNLGQYL